jgi:hypothetical protein
MFANCVSERAVHRAFEGVLLALDALGREPDRWEQEALVDALCSMACACYLDAATRIVEIRLSLLKRPAGGAADGKSAVSKEMMRRGLNHIQVHHSTAAPCVKAV